MGCKSNTIAGWAPCGREIKPTRDPGYPASGVSSHRDPAHRRPPPSHQSAEMTKRSRSETPLTRTTIVDSKAIEFKVDYEQTMRLTAGKAVHSDPISVGGHMWRLNWYPHGIDKVKDTRRHSLYMSMMVELMGESQSARAIIEASLLIGSDDEALETAPSASSKGPLLHEFRSSIEFGWRCFIDQYSTFSFISDGQITVFFSIKVLPCRFVISMPPSDIGEHLGTLLDSTDGADVSFMVDGETFHAHRAVVAARSPVFRAELLGSMSEATTSSSISLHDIAPAAFRIMLRFMYTDAFPGDDELGESPTEIFKHLLAAADRYALDRLKIMCAQKIWVNVSLDTVCDALACAEIYNCPQLKSKCIEFVVAKTNFKEVVLTESFMQLGLKFPSILAEVRERVRANDMVEA